jgi:hypothetical protein
MNGANDRGPLRELLANLAGLYMVGILFASAFMIAGIIVTYDGVDTQDRHYPHQEVQSMENVESGLQGIQAVPREIVQQTLETFAVQPAYAHANERCTTSSGKVSNDTGFSRHLTSWRYDRGGYRYTITRHQVRSGGPWHTVDKYYGKIRLGRC